MILKYLNALLSPVILGNVLTASAEDYPRLLAEQDKKVYLDISRGHLRLGYTPDEFKNFSVSLHVSCWSDGRHTYWYNEQSGSKLYRATNTYGDAYVYDTLERAVDSVCLTFKKEF